MSQPSNKYVKFGAAITLIVLTLAYLAYLGAQESKSYYVTIKELHGMGDDVYKKNLRVAGNVLPGSIKMSGPHADFQLVENGETLRVVYKGSEPPPDTFKDNAQAPTPPRCGWCRRGWTGSGSRMRTNPAPRKRASRRSSSWRGR